MAVSPEDILTAARIGTTLALRNAPSSVKQDSADVFQEACIGALKAARRYEAGKGVSFVSFAVHGARGHATDSFRRGKYPRVHKSLDIQMADKPSPKAIDAGFLNRALATLPSRQKQVVEMVYYGGLKQNEIAALLNTGMSNISNAYTAGMAKLRQRLKGYSLSDFI